MHTGAFSIELSTDDIAAAYPGPRGNSVNTKRDVAYPVDMKDTWAYLTFVYDGDTVHVYQNGVFVYDAEIDEATNNDSPLVFGNNCHIATGAVGDAAWCGWIDEVRLVDDVKSADWVAAEYAAMTGGVLEYHKVENLSAQATSGYQEGDEIGGLVITTAQAEWLNGYLGGFADKAALEAAISAAQDISGAFNSKTTETFEFTDTGNTFFKAVIE